MCNVVAHSWRIFISYISDKGNGYDFCPEGFSSFAYLMCVCTIIVCYANFARTGNTASLKRLVFREVYLFGCLFTHIVLSIKNERQNFYEYFVEMKGRHILSYLCYTYYQNKQCRMVLEWNKWYVLFIN